MHVFVYSHTRTHTHMHRRTRMSLSEHNVFKCDIARQVRCQYSRCTGNLTCSQSEIPHTLPKLTEKLLCEVCEISDCLTDQHLCWMLDVGCWMSDMGCWLLQAQSNTVDILRKMWEDKYFHLVEIFKKGKFKCNRNSKCLLYSEHIIYAKHIWKLDSASNRQGDPNYV